MTPLQQLQSILSKTYTDEDGAPLTPKALPGLTDNEIEHFRQLLPTGYLPPEIEELVRFAKGFTFGPILEEIDFTACNAESPYDSLFPDSIEILGDGAGNFWMLDIAPDGTWGPVYYNCHETAVVIRHSDNLLQFLQHLDEWHENPGNSHVDAVLEAVFDIRAGKTSIPSNQHNLPEFPPEMLAGVPENFLIADLTDAPNKTGFCWAKYVRKGSTLFRHPHRPAWLLACQKPESWWRRLLPRK